MSLKPPNAQPDSRGSDARFIDPFLDEVRALKREASERAGHNIDLLCKQLQEIERTMNNPKAKRPETVRELPEDQRGRLAS